MSSMRALFRKLLPIIAVFGLAWALFQARYCRSVTLRNLASGETQTVSVAFMPCHAVWTVSGDVDGNGVVVLSYLYSNRVSGKFSVHGRGDYYDSNASVRFIPDGKATGKIRASFRFDCWP